MRGPVDYKSRGHSWPASLTSIAEQATLLLPMTPASSLPLTPQTFKDHLIYTAPGSEVIVTLSGLVGSLEQ